VDMVETALMGQVTKIDANQEEIEAHFNQFLCWQYCTAPLEHGE